MKINASALNMDSQPLDDGPEPLSRSAAAVLVNGRASASREWGQQLLMEEDCLAECMNTLRS